MLMLYVSSGHMSPEEHLMFGGFALSVAIILIFLPDILWRLYERWGYTDDTEPSPTFLMKCRISGILITFTAFIHILYFVY